MTPQEPTRDMLGRVKLTSVPAALNTLLTALEKIPKRVEEISVENALDRVTAAKIISPEDLPPADRSTMDGFAVIAADTYGASQSLPAYLNISGEVEMGIVPEGKLTRGNCYKIPTGGLVPNGSDGVVMFEHTVPVDEKMIEVVKGVGSGANIIKRGEDITVGSQAVPAGYRLRPPDLGLLAGIGITEVTVNKKIRVGIISTGDEIIDYRESGSLGKIRNSNAVTMAGLVRRCGAEPIDYGIVQDREKPFFERVEQAVRENDLVLFSGGSSVGVRDLGEQAIERLGSPGILVHGVSLKPGKPVIIGLCWDTPVFGLPGHPVSAMVCFEVFVRPAIYSLSGLHPRDNGLAPVVLARLMRNINSAAGRLDVVRVSLVFEEGEARAYPILGRSGAISTMSRANGYFLVAEDCQGIPNGEQIEVYPYQ
jgi:molybdopterin molybdotransferase